MARGTGGRISLNSYIVMYGGGAVGVCTVPKPGFKSITVSESAYERFHEAYTKSKEDLSRRGVKSFSGYVSYMLEEQMLKDETFARHAPRIKSISVEADCVILRDNVNNRIVEVAIRDGELACQQCESTDCVHVGFVFSMPDVYDMLGSKGIKRPN